MDPLAHARRQQRIEALCAASLRALTGDASLHYRGERVHRGAQPLPSFAPHLSPSIDDDDFGSFRGAADGIALRLAGSDEALHRALAPEDRVERLVYGWLEQLRAESIAPAAMRGIARNLRHRHEQWSLAFHRSGLTDTARGLLLYTLVQICRARLASEPVVEATEGLIEHTRAALYPLVGHELAAMRRHRHDQAAYAPHALAIARIVREQLEQADDDEAGHAPRGAPGTSARRRLAPLFVDDDREPGEVALDAAIALEREGAIASDSAMRAYTRAYDREIPALELARREQLRTLRETLDRTLERWRPNVPGIARAWQALLARPAPDGWDSGAEEGAIDGRRLARLIAAPTERSVFRREREMPAVDAIVTVLVDCSGSMKARIGTVAPFVDLVARTLELAGAETEVLGFTTGAWHGGRAWRDWQRAGGPPAPGRLNELAHLVYKDADTSWRRARLAMAAMLSTDGFREGVDGEAVRWACARLRRRERARRLLLVVSDGCPMDAATTLANGPGWLDAQLARAVRDEEAAGGVEIYGLGVGFDLSAYYRASHALDVGDAPGAGSVRELLRWLRGAMGLPRG